MCKAETIYSFNHKRIFFNLDSSCSSFSPTLQEYQYIIDHLRLEIIRVRLGPVLDKGLERIYPAKNKIA